MTGFPWTLGRPSMKPMEMSAYIWDDIQTQRSEEDQTQYKGLLMEAKRKKKPEKSHLGLNPLLKQKRGRGSLTNTDLLKRVHSLVANNTLLLCAHKHIRESTALLALHIDNKKSGINSLYIAASMKYIRYQACPREAQIPYVHLIFLTQLIGPHLTQ